MEKEFSRRSFLKVGTTAALGLAVAPSMLMGKSKKKETMPYVKALNCYNKICYIFFFYHYTSLLQLE